MKKGERFIDGNVIHVDQNIWPGDGMRDVTYDGISNISSKDDRETVINSDVLLSVPFTEMQFRKLIKICDNTGNLPSDIVINILEKHLFKTDSQNKGKILFSKGIDLGKDIISLPFTFKNRLYNNKS